MGIYVKFTMTTHQIWCMIKIFRGEGVVDGVGGVALKDA